MENIRIYSLETGRDMYKMAFQPLFAQTVHNADLRINELETWARLPWSAQGDYFISCAYMNDIILKELSSTYQEFLLDYQCP